MKQARQTGRKMYRKSSKKLKWPLSITCYSMLALGCVCGPRLCVRKDAFLLPLLILVLPISIIDWHVWKWTQVHILFGLSSFPKRSLYLYWNCVCLLLKTPCTLVIGHRELKIEFSWKCPPCGLAFTVPRVQYRLLGRKVTDYVCSHTNLPGKMHSSIIGAWPFVDNSLPCDAIWALLPGVDTSSTIDWV